MVDTSLIAVGVIDDDIVGFSKKFDGINIENNRNVFKFIDGKQIVAFFDSTVCTLRNF
jgi:hypothetical protein